jgi:hypothetical protein
LRIKERNLYAPWRQPEGSGSQARWNTADGSLGENRYDERDQSPGRRIQNARPIVGLDVSLFPFDPEIDWNIRTILGGDADYSSLTKKC